MNLLTSPKTAFFLLAAFSSATAFVGQHHVAFHRQLLELGVSTVPKKQLALLLSNGKHRKGLPNPDEISIESVDYPPKSERVKEVANGASFDAVTSEVLQITVWATSLWAVNLVMGSGWTDLQGLQHQALLSLLPPLQLPIDFLLWSSPVLVLFLAVQLVTSYRRWSQVHDAWDDIVHISHSIMRQAAVWLQDEDASKTDHSKVGLIARLAAAIWSFPRSLTEHLDPNPEAYADECRVNLRPDLAEALIEARHKPTRATYEISSAIQDFPVSEVKKSLLDSSVSRLCQAMSVNDRVAATTTEIPVSSWLPQVWLACLPLGLWPITENSWNHVAIIPATLTVSYVVLGLLQQSTRWNDPLASVPLYKITSSIGLSAEEHVEWFLKDTEQPTNKAATDRYENLSP